MATNFKSLSPSEQIMEVFLQSIEAAGGPRHMLERRIRLWLPELMLSAYVVEEQEGRGERPEAIAAKTGLSIDQIEARLAVAPRAAGPLAAAPGAEEERAIVAGGLARAAWNRLNAG